MSLKLYYPSLCQDIKRYKLGNPESFHYPNQSNCYELDGVDDSKEYEATRRAMEIVGISHQEQVLSSTKCFNTNSEKVLLLISC